MPHHLLLAMLLAAAPGTFTNPVLPGFYPDPSVVRVGEDYYLVTSSFEYFPGIPVFHSRDLVTWEQIGHALDRPSQLDLDGVAASDGIYASTVRHHRGTFYVVTTLVRRKPRELFTNFVVTTKDPAGPWSEPYVLSDSYYRIDPSLFFDDDGKAYYTGNRTVTPAPYAGHRVITAQELDLATMKLVGQPHDIGEGHARGAYAPEAPHLYRRDGWYYLLIAEGGTFETHAVTISRSKSVFGPYEQHQGNPILTHRHLGPGLDIHSVGHADLVETQKGQWWMVALGMRGVPGHCCNLGRETFLVPVSWSPDGWPIVAPGVGRVRGVETRPDLPPFDVASAPARDEFDGRRLALAYNFVRTPRDGFWSLARRPGWLRLLLKKDTLAEDTNPAFIGRRMQHPSFATRTRIDFRPRADGESAGLAVRNGNQHLRFVEARKGNATVLRVLSRAAGQEHLLAEAPAPRGPLYLKIECRRETDFSFFVATEPERWTRVGGVVDGRVLGHTGGGSSFTGSFVGIYATSAGAPSGNFADYDFFEYAGE